MIGRTFGLTTRLTINLKFRLTFTLTFGFEIRLEIGLETLLTSLCPGWFCRCVASAGRWPPWATSWAGLMAAAIARKKISQPWAGV